MTKVGSPEIRQDFFMSWSGKTLLKCLEDSAQPKGVNTYDLTHNRLVVSPIPAT